MNVLVAAVVGALLSGITVIGGVSAYQAQPDNGVKAQQIYQYGDQ